MNLSENNYRTNERLCNQNGHYLPITLPLEYSNFKGFNNKMEYGDDGNGVDGRKLFGKFWGEHPSLIKESSRNDTVLSLCSGCGD